MTQLIAKMLFLLGISLLLSIIILIPNIINRIRFGSWDERDD